MKVSFLLCVCFAALCTQLLGCGDQADTPDLALAHHSSGPELSGSSGSSGATSASASASATDSGGAAPEAECVDPCAKPSSCGTLCITMSGHGSSCQLAPTANDLTRPPRKVQFDCSELPRGDNGYDFDEQGHVALTGDACAALNQGGPHRVALILGCPPEPAD